MNKYIWGLDLSLACSGISIFTDDAKHVKTVSIETKAKDEHGRRLRTFGEELSKLKFIYKPEKVIFENGFYKFNNSTKAIYKTVGVAQYIMYDCEQVFYPPATVKKTVSGKGNCKKDELRQIIQEKYNAHQFKNDDESDSYAIALTYFIKEGII